MTSSLVRLSAPFFVLLSFATPPAWAIETQTLSILALRGSKALDSTNTIDFTFSERDLEGFEKHDREIAETRYFKRFDDNELMVGYHLEFDRTGLPGNEHRLMQQIRHQFTVDNNNFDTSMRIEERYFDSNSTNGSRLRWQTRWNYPVSPGNQLRLGYEWIYNIDDISASTRHGFSQSRLIGSVQHNLKNGDRVELEVQTRYLHIVGADNRLQNQVQLTYINNF